MPWTLPLVNPMFVDTAEIYVRGGNGGHGCASFRRERFVPRGGPDGGDGGDGGSVILTAEAGLDTLLDYAGKHHCLAENGRPGQGNMCQGKSGQDIVVKLPPGTLVYDRGTGVLLKDLDRPGVRVCVATGGRGGRGNKHFATATHQTPRECEPGQPGEERWLRLELKLIADVGIIGLPNAGKSTLLARVSRAHPKIADYPFTTLTPQLGIVEIASHRRMVLADIPGLIEGAHAGAGLGDAFLRHIERTTVLLHLIDAYPAPGAPRPADAYHTVRAELQRHSATLAAKPELIVANKTDLADNTAAIDALAEELNVDLLAISAVTGAGVGPLIEALWKCVRTVRRDDPSADPDAPLPHPPHLPNDATG